MELNVTAQSSMRAQYWCGGSAILNSDMGQKVKVNQVHTSSGRAWSMFHLLVHIMSKLRLRQMDVM